MAGRRVYGGSSMMALLQSEEIPHETIEAWLGSSSSPGGLHGAGSMVNFEDVCGSTNQRPFYRPTDLEETGDEDLDECLQQPEKKRRLSADQVQILEKNFEIENKLEPERKIQLARDLGLQPRQVAIWFQNRRARWKTKQLEKDYEVLKSSYNVLKTDYENLAKENEKLKAEVRSLTDKLLIKEKGNSEALELDKSSQGQNLRLHAISDVKRPETSAVVFKQEDVSSGNSAVLDSDSPHCTDGGQLEPAGSSNAFEPDHSDLSHTEDDGEVRACCVLKLEDNSNNYGFPMEDQSFWCWPY